MQPIKAVKRSLKTMKLVSKDHYFHDKQMVHFIPALSKVDF